MIQWSFGIPSGSACIIWQSSLSGLTASKLLENFRSLANRWYGRNRLYGQLSYQHRSQSLGSPRSWLKTGCSKQRPKTLRQISPRKLQAVISSHPTRYLGGSSCTWHILLETPERVTKEPTHLAWQRKWKQSNQSETCSLPHHISWPLHRWASKLYACAAALVARRQPVQVCREASRNALRIHWLTDGLQYLCLCSKLACRMPWHSATNATIWGRDHNGSSDCGSKICPGCAVKDALGRHCHMALRINPTACQVMSGLFLQRTILSWIVVPSYSLFDHFDHWFA